MDDARSQRDDGGASADTLARPGGPPTDGGVPSDATVVAGNDPSTRAPSRLGPLAAVAAHPVRTAIPVVVFIVLAAAISLVRKPVYTSEQQLLVGTLDVTANAVPGYVTAGQQLASSYARLASTDAIINPAAHRLHMSPRELTSHISATNVVQSPQVTLDATASTQHRARVTAIAVSNELINYVNTLTNNKTVSNQIEAAYKDASAAYQQALQAQNDLNFQLGQLRDPRSPLYQSLTPAALAQATKDTENKLIAAGISVDAAKLHSDALDRSFTEAQQGYAEPQGLQALGSPAALGSDRKKFLGIACAVGLVVGAFFGVGWASLTAKRRRRRAHQWRRRAGVGS